MNVEQMMDGPSDWDEGKYQRERAQRMDDLAKREQESADLEIINARPEDSDLARYVSQYLHGRIWDQRIHDRAIRVLSDELQKHGIYGGMVSCMVVAEAWLRAVDNARATAACQLKQEDRDAR